MSEITVTQLRKTNTFPQEWEGMTDENHFVTIHHRGGQLTVSVGVTKEQALSGEGIEYTAVTGTGNVLETGKMKGIVGPLIGFDI